LYIIKHAELKGFRETEIEIMAHVARYHRRSTPKKRHEEYWALKKPIRNKIKALSGILRVADGLDRSHYQNVKKLDFELTDEHFNIRIWTEADPQLEIWGAMRKSHLLTKVLGRKVKVEAKDLAVIG
jgi:exopolyphosphatase/guanosine-5'-triphosphate,3'-diphosphate pyrophosphatase